MPIVAVNISDGEILTYPLPLVVGKVDKGFIRVNGEIKVLVGNKCFRWPIHQGHFRALVPLTVGENVVTLTWLTDELSLTLHYQLIDPVYRIRLVYIYCHDHDGSFQAPPGEENTMESACRRIALACNMAQSFTAEAMRYHGFGRQTFHLELDSETNETKCLPFQTKLSFNQALEMSSESLWMYLARDLMTSDLTHKDTTKFLGFLSFTRYAWTPEKGEVPRTHRQVMALTRGHAALGGGGLALLGTGCLHTWSPCVAQLPVRLTDPTMIDRRQLMDDSANRGFYWACYSTGLGALLHELGHTFDLGHTATGIMCRGDNIYLAFLPAPNPTDLQMGINVCVCGTEDLETDDQPHWARSSSVMLHFHK
ncbi:hypothetical protein LAZ67_8003816 [Cordylochernes scorpioides]|uniref:Zinc metalloproteinase n=1 Tax=Cordylochernes scorpioides TaxID=51811 RepID=A0ABY6KTU7_9ARAC|nr:hypothetical protein LAZ67_8003816 [Cordylochernes scorpioides]